MSHFLFCLFSLPPQFFSKYEKLLHSENYVTKRQSLKVRSNILDSKEVSCYSAALLHPLFFDLPTSGVTIGGSLLCNLAQFLERLPFLAQPLPLQHPTCHDLLELRVYLE